jgi:hypothetical protein
MKRSDTDIDHLLRDWHRVASTARPPTLDDPRREVRGGSAAAPASLLALVIVAVVAIAVLGRQGTGPSATASPDSSTAAQASPAAHAASSTVRDGGFELTLTVGRDRYAAGEDILATASVTYLGPAGEITVGHGGSPVLFTVQEIGGSRAVEGGMDLPCLQSTWSKGAAQSFPWVRSGGYSNSNPTENDRFNKAYLEDGPLGGLRLPAGTWRLRVTLLVMPDGGCGPDAPVPLSADVTIVVSPAAGSAEPTAPADTPTTGPALLIGPVVRCARLGEVDCEGAIALARDIDPAAYTHAELVVADDTCAPGLICDRLYPFSALVVFATRAGSSAGSAAFFVHGASGPEAAERSSADGASWITDMVEAGLTIAPGTTLFPVRTTAPVRSDTPVGCPEALVGGTLVELDATGIGLDQGAGPEAVEWPFGFAGRRDADGTALVDVTGTVIGHVGLPFEGGGAYLTDLLLVCSW